MYDQTQNQAYLPHERLDVYRLALEFRRSLTPLSRMRGIAPLRDQLFRAADSVVLNIAEGAGRNSRADKQRHYESRYPEGRLRRVHKKKINRV